MNVKDSVAVVTGGSSGIGLALAKELLSLGAKGVVITSRSKDKVEKVARELAEETRAKTSENPPQVLGVRCDASSWEDNIALMKAANDTFGRIDYIFANATGGEHDFGRYDLFSKPAFSPAYETIESVNYTIHAAIPYLASSTSTPVQNTKEKPEGGPGRDRAIIITGSEGSFAPLEVSPTYTVAKNGLNGLTFCFKSHLAQLGIRINCLAPGFIETALSSGMFEGGILDKSDSISMQLVVDSLIRFVNNTALSGVVTRIRTSRDMPFDVVAEPQMKTRLEHWLPFYEKMEQAQVQAQAQA